MDAAVEAAVPAPAGHPCDALDLLPPDLWAHALEQLEEKRDVVHAAACSRALADGQDELREALAKILYAPRRM
ncbi:hypothetical protein FOA52_007465 [Chlamydomonas sp. UWO 241]|nr:hypothetical protein FOA52_007465 [Chlamydomonas sp. UWO 241]